MAKSKWSWWWKWAFQTTTYRDWITYLKSLEQHMALPKITLYCILNPFSAGILWKIDIKEKKKTSLSGYISKTRTNSEPKLKSFESSFNFLQSSVVFCMFYPRGYTAGVSVPYNTGSRCQWLAALKELMMSQKVLNLVFFAYFFWKWTETFEKLQVFTFGQEQCLYLKVDTRVRWPDSF